MSFKTYIIVYPLLAATLLAACSNDDTAGNMPDGSQKEIRLTADCWQVMTRATTYDSNTALQDGTFACYAYQHDGTTQYISGSTVSYSDSQWLFDDGKHYWPATGALDFFAYMPASLTNTYCTIDPTAYDAETNTDGYSAGTARITCTNLPVNINNASDATQELILAYTADQDKTGTNTSAQPTAGHVALTFKHPFARVIFKLSEESGTDVTINKITVTAADGTAVVKNNGTCTFNGTTATWTPTGDAANLVVSGSPATHDTRAYLVIPQTFSTNLKFTADVTWNEWLEVRRDISATVTVDSWAPGTSYTYSITLNKNAMKVETTKYTEQW